MTSVYILNHRYVSAETDEDRLIGAYASRERAIAAIKSLRELPGFRESPTLMAAASDGSAESAGFYISERVLDETEWVSGFDIGEADDEVTAPIAPMTDEEQAVADSMNFEQLQAIDHAILDEAGPRWHKVARIVGNLMSTLPEFPQRIPLALIVQRIESLVGRGKLTSDGDLRRIGQSEVRRN
jgi:hypothetical protein